MALEERSRRRSTRARSPTARTVGDLEVLVGPGSLRRRHRHRGWRVPPNVAARRGAPREPPVSPLPRRDATDGPVDFPSWNRTWPARAIRRLSLPTWILPLARAFAWIEVAGLEHLDALDGPVIFAANHQSHMDAPVILWALPPRWRYRTRDRHGQGVLQGAFLPRAPRPPGWLTNSLNYYLASLFFNAFPLPQREAGTRQTLRYIGDAARASGYSVLIFPEGKRTQGGEINPFRPGIGMIGAAPRRAGRARPADRPRPGAAPVLEDGQAGPGAGRVRRAAAARRATTTRRSRQVEDAELGSARSAPRPSGPLIAILSWTLWRID